MDDTKPDRDTLQSAVTYIKSLNMDGAARDKATAHVLAGIEAAGGGTLPGGKYIDLLEAALLADAAQTSEA